MLQEHERVREKTFHLGLWGWTIVLINAALGVSMVLIGEPWGVANLVFVGLMIGLSVSKL